MSAFAAKRKARIIQTLDDDDDTDMGSSTVEEDKKEVPVPQAPIKFGRSKPAKSSSLRKSINFNDDDAIQIGDGGALLARDTGIASAGDGDDDAFGPVVVRPALSRSGSTKQKKRHSTASRLSFGPDDSAAREGEGAPVEVITPKKPLAQRALQNNALRKSASFQNLASLPTRFGSDEDRPRYSKEYLEELQSSTPNTPQKVSSLGIEDGDVMDLDPSELDGALIVQSQDLSRRSPSAQALTTRDAPSVAHVLSETEIRERKERRARLAHETDFISLDASDDDSAEPNRITLNFAKKKTESRLIAEDEDLGEGYEEFVSDGGLALGRKAEREAERRHRQEMAELIQAAEDNSDAESDDSEAERRAAYESAQRRAGMDGLQRPDDDDADMEEGGASVIPRMKPLPDVNEVIQRMRNLVRGLEDEVAHKRARIADLEKEKEEISARENEVQEVLNQAGAKYQALVGSAAVAGDVSKLVTQSPLRLPPGMSDLPVPVERGLESFGTPTKRPDAEEMGIV